MHKFSYFGDDFLFFSRLINKVPLEDMMLLDLHSNLGFFEQKELAYMIGLRKEMCIKISAINGINKLLKSKDGAKYEKLLKERGVLHGLENLTKPTDSMRMFQ